MDITEMDINHYLVNAFERLGKSQSQVVKDLGKSQPYVSALMNGKKKVGKDVAKQLSELYGFDEGLILIGKDEPHKSTRKEVKEPKVRYNSQIKLNTEITGYYYPSVSASAGLQNGILNSEIEKVPISIPNWGNDLFFINVYGDSMYPKYCSGEVIGVKEIEPKFVNYGFAYVVVMKDSEVYLKYIRKGKDDNHWILASENKLYDEKEFHISLISKIFIIKGVITKVTM